MLGVFCSCLHFCLWNATQSIGCNIKSLRCLRHLWTRFWHHLWTDLHQIWNIASPYHVHRDSWWWWCRPWQLFVQKWDHISYDGYRNWSELYRIITTIFGTEYMNKVVINIQWESVITQSVWGGITVYMYIHSSCKFPVVCICQKWRKLAESRK